MKLIIFKIIVFLIVESVWSAKTKYSDTFKSVCGQGNSKKRIIGGSNAVEGEFPFIARLLLNVYPAPYFFCDGSLITDRHILTAAHCFKRNFKTNQIIVRLGDHNVAPNKLSKHAAVFNALKIIPAGRINESPEIKDIAIIKLAKKVKFTRWISPICLPYRFSPPTLIGKNVTVIGFGMVNQKNGTLAAILQKVDITVKPLRVCLNVSRPNGEICAGNVGKTDCYGDSGGPLFKILRQKYVRRYTQVGIVSYGVDIYCGKIGSIFTDVNYYLTWIEKVLNE